MLPVPLLRQVLKVVLPPRREAQNQEISFSDFSRFRNRSGGRSGLLFGVFWAPFGHHFGALGLSWEVFWTSLRTLGSAGVAF